LVTCIKEREAMKCLAIVSAGLGNIVETTPMLVALESVVDKLDILLLSNWPDVDKLLPWDCINTLSNDNDYDVIVGAWWAKECQIITSAKHFGKKTVVPRLNVLEWSEVECNMDVARQLGFTGITPPPKLNEVGKSLVEGEYVVLSSGYQKSTSHVIWKNKSWPHWKQLATMFKDKGIRTVIVGTTEECEDWHKDIIDYDLCGKTSTVELAATLRGAQAVIGCDNGPAHVADAYGVPVVALFGPGSTIKNTYYQGRVIFMPNSVVPCRPCHHNLGQMANCKNNLCMKLITTKQVFDVYLKEIENRKSNKPDTTTVASVIV